jgi:hypothetical protein
MVIFSQNGQDKIADHGKAEGIYHLGYLLKEEYGKNSVKNEEQFNPQVHPPEKNDAGNHRVEHKIDNLPGFILIIKIEIKDQKTHEHRKAGNDVRS